MAAALRKSGVYIVGAKRTAFGAFGGSLKSKTATDLAEVSSRSALEASGVPKEAVGSVFFGNVIQSNKDTAGASRYVCIRLGLPIETPGMNVNRLCASGFQSIVSAAHAILMGDCRVAIAGGTENMSETPYSVWNMRFGSRLGVDNPLVDVLWTGLIDQQCKMPMGVTAENLAAKYKISRQECDEFSVLSQDRWRKAHEAGAFKEEIAPVKIKTKKGVVDFVTDEHPRTTSVEAMAKLPPVFKKDGVIHAGNSSGICDGSGALVLASEEAVKELNLTPLARLLGYKYVGCDPTIMGIGPVPAINGLLKDTGRKLEEIDLVEVNEAFAPQYLAVERELKLNREVTNACGGAIALGHPVGASGARIMAHLTHALRKQPSAKMAIGSACVGGGQGIALLIEKC